MGESYDSMDSGANGSMSERKRKHYEQLKEDYRGALAEVEENEGDRLRKYIKKLVKNGCPHWETTLDWEECDDGYGHWWKIYWDRCNMCGERINRRYHE